MVKYNVNLKFKENGKSLNELITNVLKIKLEKQYIICDILNKDIPVNTTHYFQNKRIRNWESWIVVLM